MNIIENGYLGGIENEGSYLMEIENYYRNEGLIEEEIEKEMVKI